MLLSPSRLADKDVSPSGDPSLLHSVSPSTRSFPPARVHVLPALIINLPPLSYMPIHWPPQFSAPLLEHSLTGLSILRSPLPILPRVHTSEVFSFNLPTWLQQPLVKLINDFYILNQLSSQFLVNLSPTHDYLWNTSFFRSLGHHPLLVLSHGLFSVCLAESPSSPQSYNSQCLWLQRGKS